MHVNQSLLYIGPNRRSQQTAIEWQCELLPVDLDAFELARSSGFDRLRSTLTRLGIAAADMETVLPATADGRDPAAALGEVVTRLALALQRAAGHRVCFSAVLAGKEPNQRRLVFEYEHSGTGLLAGALAMRLVAENLPGMVWQATQDELALTLETACDQFHQLAASHILPLDTEAILRAAERLGIPWAKLERDPYDGVEGEFRIRKNGLLMLGHSCYQHIVDGTLCIDRNPDLVPLLFDRELRYLRMRQLDLPVPEQDTQSRKLIMTRRVLRAAERIGYPLVLKPSRLKPGSRAGNRPPAGPLHTHLELRQALEPWQAAGQCVVLEQWVPGATFHLLLADHAALVLLDAAGNALPLSSLHHSVVELAQGASRELDCGLLLLSLVTQDPARPLLETGGAVIDLDPAPQLDRWLKPGSPLLDQAAESFVRCLYPASSPSRIPLIAVTGTKGKTTTSRMVASILRAAGLVPGLACSNGVYIDQDLVRRGDMAGRNGHSLVFESRAVNAGVLETARGGVAHSGFMFDACDVGVCLNVSEDHLGEYGIETLQDMAAHKRSIVARAKKAVVLNADYATCLGMLPFDPGLKVYLASLQTAAQSVFAQARHADWACTLEEIAGREWIVLCAASGERHCIIESAAIPATFGGTARVNISNAQHAVCACHALGIGLEALRVALAAFEASFENTPGRFNFYRGLPFTVIMDYVHNPDSMAQMRDFLASLDVAGRRIILFQSSGKRTDEETMAYARSAAGMFDHYVCRSYFRLRGRQAEEVPDLMRLGLLGAGVADEQITLEYDSRLAVQHTLQLARPGDLVVLSPAASEIWDMWDEIRSFKAGNPDDTDRG